MYFVYVYIDLLFVGLLCVSFCSPWGDFGPPFGSLWGALGSQGALLGVPLAPLGRRGAIWGSLGCQGELGMTLGPKGTSNSEQMALKQRACAQKVTSRNSGAYGAYAAYGPKVAQEPQLPTPLHSRRGPG